MGHTVNIILQDDLPGGKGYIGEVVTVRAGYARNFLIPTKKAFYATPENLTRFGINIDMAMKREVFEAEEVSEDKKMADVLRTYLKQKTVSVGEHRVLSL
jgi:large subunit ribosomal protein L9